MQLADRPHFFGCDELASSKSDDTCASEKYRQVGSTDTLRLATKPKYSLVTPDANKDCHAKFEFLYAFGDAQRRMTDTLHPPIQWNFQIYPGFSYFPTAAAKRERQSNGEYWWKATNDVGAKNHTEPSVQYQIEATVQNYASPTTTVVVKGEIKYIPK